MLSIPLIGTAGLLPQPPKFEGMTSFPTFPDGDLNVLISAGGYQCLRYRSV